MFFARANRGDENSFAVFLAKHFVVTATNCDRRVAGVLIWREEFFDKGRVDFVVAVDKTDVVAGSFF